MISYEIWELRDMHMTYATYFAHDIDKLAEYYIAIGFEEVESSRSPYYREVFAGGAKIGFAAQAAYENLGLEDDADTKGIRSVLTFDVGTPADVAPATDKAVAAGGKLVKAGFQTVFGQFLSVLRDPEGNVFRLSAVTS